MTANQPGVGRWAEAPPVERSAHLVTLQKTNHIVSKHVRLLSVITRRAGSIRSNALMQPLIAALAIKQVNLKREGRDAE